MNVDVPTIISGGIHRDSRGTLRYNNSFNMAVVKRMYVLENENLDTIRAWQGHLVEQRWFAAIQGTYTIKLAPIDQWPNPKANVVILEFILDSLHMDLLHIPAGYMSSIQMLETGSILMVYSDYAIGEVIDDLKLPLEYFKNI